MFSNSNYNIKSITFGLYSTQEILSMSVCKLDNIKKSGYGSVYDLRMGTNDFFNNCKTCDQNSNICQGHFGHIELNEMILHPLFYKDILKCLSCICFKCNRLILTRNQLDLLDLNGKFNKIVEKCKKTIFCCHDNCKNVKPEIKLVNTTEIKIVLKYEYKTRKNYINLSVQEIDFILSNIYDEDLLLMGINKDICHPKNYIIKVLPVLPCCARPYVKIDGRICDDDLTIQYNEIIKVNNKLLDVVDNSKKQKLLAILQFRISTTFNNSRGKAKHSTNSRPIKGIKERLTGKQGQLRMNMMGKRCNQTGRTVIGPDPTLKMDQLAVPELMSKILTIPVKVTKFNFDKLQKLTNKGKVNYVLKNNGKKKINIKRYRVGTKIKFGDIIIRDGQEITTDCLKKGDIIKRGPEFITDIIPTNRDYDLTIGDIVERHLQDGDYVLLNRQPTLHKASMMAMQVIVKKFKTLRMNLAITKPFNADFDGDEMNIHVPQTTEAYTELRMLANVKNNIISSQNGKPNMAIVQDSLLGSYKMTQKIQTITKAQFFNITMKLYSSPLYPQKEKMMTSHEILDSIDFINTILKEKGKTHDCFNGKGLFSMFLPRDFIYEYKNNKDIDEPVVKIWKGVLYEGTLDKNVLGSTHNSLIKILHKEYGLEYTSYFIDCVQFITNNFLLINGFSVGLGDCLITDKSKKQQINDNIEKCYLESEIIKKTTQHNTIRELRINAILNKAKDIGLRIAKDSFHKKNNFLSTVNSGSKGDYFNITQITGLLGQQNLKGKRVPLSLNNGRRSLPHYPFQDLSVEKEYESRGFISNGFLNGLSPRQFYFHAMSGREGICDTAMGTATSGYMQRKIVKLSEDIKINHDYTVRNATDKIYQFAYGETNIDTCKNVKVNGSMEICNVDRIIQKLNMKYEK
jgi:DNA-directed RNA polymerase beta' subunit